VLTYTDEGPREGPPLIAVHGIPGSVRDFRYLAPQVTRGVRLVRLDLPGFGGSAAEPAGVRTLEGRVAAVLSLADHLGFREFAVLGHSMGGGTALLTAAAAPTRMNGLVLIASLGISLHRGLGMKPRTFRLVAHALRVPGLRALCLPPVREQYRRRRFPGFETMTPAQFSTQLFALGATDFEAIRRAVRSPLPPILDAYACDDHMVETHVSEELADALPGARVLRFAEGGHNIQKTRAVEIGAGIRDLLRAR
jgi:pimeloyl-ACP methyl ester carboxylesterase